MNDNKPQTVLELVKAVGVGRKDCIRILNLRPHHFSSSKNEAEYKKAIALFKASISQEIIKTMGFNAAIQSKMIDRYSLFETEMILPHKKPASVKELQENLDHGSAEYFKGNISKAQLEMFLKVMDQQSQLYALGDVEEQLAAIIETLKEKEIL